MNRVILVGRISREITYRVSQSGIKNAQSSIAVNRPFKNKDGNIDADFINFTVFGDRAENLSKYCSKGDLISIEGRIQTRSYDAQDGTKRYVTEVVAENIEYLAHKSNEARDIQENSSSVPIQEDPFASFGSEVTLSDEDLPF